MRNPNTQGNRGICFLVLSCAGPPGIRAVPSRRTTFVGLSKQNGRTTKNAQMPERGIQIDEQRKFQIVQAKRTGCANCVFPSWEATKKIVAQALFVWWYGSIRPIPLHKNGLRVLKWGFTPQKENLIFSAPLTPFHPFLLAFRQPLYWYVPFFAQVCWRLF